MQLMKLVARLSDVAAQHSGAISGGRVDFDFGEATVRLVFADSSYEVTIKEVEHDEEGV